MTVMAASIGAPAPSQKLAPRDRKSQDYASPSLPPRKMSPSVALEDMEDADLMDRVVMDDQAAYREIVKRHFEKMFGLAFRMIRRGADAEDITQDVFFKLWVNRHKWNREGAQIGTWLYRVTLNRCIDYKRKPVTQTLDSAPEPEDDAPSAVTLIQRSQTSKLLKDAIARLPDKQQAALALFYQQDLSNAAAADVMGISVNAMESLLKRARQRLRELLKQSQREMLASGNE